MGPFVRQTENRRGLVAFVVPQETEPPGRFRFHYLSYQEALAVLDSGAEISDGIYTFHPRDGVLGLFETVAWSHNEVGWSFASSRVLDVLAAVRIGVTLDVHFDTPFAEVTRIARYHFPAGVPDSGYGQYRIHITEDAVTPRGFRIVSSFEEGQEPTKSRLPFFFGFRVYGRGAHAEPDPVWRSLLGLSIRYCQEERWHLSVLHAAFSLEAFLDGLLKQKLEAGGVPESYVDHILKVGEKRDEFQALNEFAVGGQLSKKEVNRLYDQVNASVFSKRNHVAHGRTSSVSMSQEDALEAIRTTVDLIWRFGPDSRQYLLISTSTGIFEAMIDPELLRSCQTEYES